MVEHLVPDELIEAVNSYQKFIIVAHKEPDADTLCSALGLSLFLERLGKTTFRFTPGPFKRSEVMHMEDSFLTDGITDRMRENAAVIVVDFSSKDRLGHLEEQVEGLPVIVIDHHLSGTKFGDIRWIDPSSPATTLMIQRLIYAYEQVPSKEEAEILFLGFCTDTGFFRHLDHGTHDYIVQAANLIEFGASPTKTFRHMTGGRTLASRKLLGRIVSRVEEYYDKKLLITWEDLQDRQELKTNDRDSDMLYQILLSITGVEAVAVLRQESENKCTIGLRSVHEVNVGALAASYGGGGHKRAAGFAYEGKLPDIKEKLIESFKEII